MERLTIRSESTGDILFANPNDPEGEYNIFDLAKYAEEGDGTEAGIMLDIVKRLAAYEDAEERAAARDESAANHIRNQSTEFI